MTIDTQSLLSAATSLQKAFGTQQVLATLVLGSGWGEVVEMLSPQKTVSAEEVFPLKQGSVEGHSANIHLVETPSGPILVFQGRRHFYEGLGWTPVAMPIAFAKAFQSKAVLLTNAAGGLHPSFEPGDLMFLSDHINLLSVSPLIGEHEEFWGPRFPDMSSVYDEKMRAFLFELAEKNDCRSHAGVYAITSGPQYETPSEIQMFRSLGVDAIGMSTVPEAILARAAGMKVAGISCISNKAAGISETELSHDEVIEALDAIMPKLAKLIKDFSDGLGEQL